MLPSDESYARTIKTAYFAGLIDGEGHISIHKCRPKSSPYVKTVPVIAVKMTCQKTVEALAAHFRLGTVTRRKVNPKHPTWLPQWAWQVKCKNAFLVAQEIHPFLITKKGDAEEIIQHRPKMIAARKARMAALAIQNRKR